MSKWLFKRRKDVYFYLRMRSYRFIFLCCYCSLLSIIGQGQSLHYQLETFGTRDGMLSSKVYALAQASNRMLLIGTELGISVYDGYRFTNYQYDTRDEPLGRVLCLTEDSAKGIWVGGDKGLFYFFDGEINKITLQGNTPLAIEALLTDQGGNIWAGDINALYKISSEQIENIHRKNISVLNISPFASFNKRVFALAEDKKRNIYIGSYDGIFKISTGTSIYESIWTNPTPAKSVRSIAAPSPDSIFWNLVDGHPSQMIKGKILTTFTEDYLGRTVFTNKQKVLALTTNGVGNFKDGLVKPIVTLSTVTNNAVVAMIDAEENIWVGSWEGLQKFRKTAFQQFTLQHQTQKEIYSFLEKSNGQLLFGSNRGLVFSKKTSGIGIEKNIPPLFSLAEVQCMYEDHSGALWAGSGYQGISRLKNNKLTNWKNTGYLKDNNCEALYPAPAGNLFACTENGVTLLDPKLNDPAIAHFAFQKKYARPPELFGCFQMDNSVFWFYGSQGLFTLRDSFLINDSIVNIPAKSLYINNIIRDKKGNIWIATLGKGLLQCRFENEKLVLYKQYNSHNGLPSDNALAVLADKNDNIWCGDYMSFSLFVHPGPAEQLITFNEKDGLLSSYYQTLKLVQQQNGTIWGLTSMGMVSFHPDSIGLNELEPVVMLNNVSVIGSAINLSNQQSVLFPYDQNSLQFQYTAICLTDPSKVRYAYRIKELDSNWTFTTSRNIDFNFLKEGAYTFELKACNNNNVWTRQPLQYRFTVKPPYWQTLWFRLLLVSAIALIIFLVFRNRISSIKAKTAIRQQLAELEAQAIRAQMNPHFIFNSLNAIQESIITEKVDAAYDYLSRFSKLLRMVLDHSDKNFIPLASEMEMIRLYLSLEALRFSHSFNYTIVEEKELDKDDLFIPSLLLQPFVENAIWHGLINKEGEKNLILRFAEKDNFLECCIEDNGIGRTRAAAIKQQKLGAGRFESKGTKLAMQRIEILNREKSGTASIETIDLLDANGTACGTKVVVKVSVNLLIKKTSTHD